MKKNYWTIKEIVKISGYPIPSCWRWCRESKLECEKLLGAVYIIPKTKKNQAFLKLMKSKRKNK